MARRPATHTLRRYLPAVALAIALAADLTTVTFIAMTIGSGHGVPFDLFSVGGLVIGATFGIVGWLIASRRPDNTIGWVFLAIGLSQAIDVFAGTYAYYGLVVAPEPLPLAAELSWVETWAWAPGYTLLVTLSVLLFPNGRLPSPRWRPVLWASFAVMALLSVPVAIASWPYRGELLVSGIDPPDGSLLAVAGGLQFLGILASPFVALVSVAAMIVRFRRSGPTERQQLKWFTYAMVPEIAFIVSSGFLTFPPLVGALAAVLIAPLLPVAAAIAILRYRLYEIDRIVSRTIGYAVVTSLLVGAFSGVILLLQGPLGQITGGDTVGVAASTLVVAALFQPLRQRVQRVVDRRFDRARYDADRTVAAFAARLRGDVDLGAVSAEILSTTTTAVRPSNASIWIRGVSR